MKNITNKLAKLTALTLIPLMISCEEKTTVKGVIYSKRDIPREELLDNSEHKHFLINLPYQRRPILINYKKTFWNKARFNYFDSKKNEGDSVKLNYYPNREFDKYELILTNEETSSDELKELYLELTK